MMVQGHRRRNQSSRNEVPRHGAAKDQDGISKESGRVLAAAGEHVLVHHGLRGLLAAAAAHADRQPRLHVAKRGGTAINGLMNLAVSDRAADAYVHVRSAPTAGLNQRADY